MKAASVARRLLAGVACVSAGTLVALAAAVPAQATATDTPSSVEFVNTCDGTQVTIHSGTELEQYEWIIADNGPQGGAFIEELAAGESTTVFAPTGWASISVNFTGSPDAGWEWTWEAPADCPPPGDQLPPDLGEWSFDCDNVKITLVNPFDVTTTFFFVPSTGEPEQAEIAAGASTTVEFPSSEGLVVEIREMEQGGPGVLLTDPLVLRSQLWDELGCSDQPEGGEDEGDGGEAGGLPVTGDRTGLIVLAAVVLLAAGGGLLMVVRRRRPTFTA